MLLRKITKKIWFQFATTKPILARRLNYIRSGHRLTVLNLHRIAPDDGSGYRPLDPILFRELLTFVKSHYRVATFGQLSENDDRRPPLVLSFDDGYRDFIDYALPLLEEFGLSANQNIIPACALSGRPPLNVLMQDFIGKAPQGVVAKIKLPGFEMHNAKQRPNALSAFLKNRPMEKQKHLLELLLPQIEAYDEFRATPVMSVDEINSLPASIEVGAHSFEHASMAEESDDYVQEDARRCNAFFEEYLRFSPRVYAFPNGSHRPQHIDLVKRAGFDTVLLVGERFAESANEVHRFTFDATSRAEVVYRATGAHAAPFLQG